MRSSLRLLNLEVAPRQGSRTLYVCSVCRQETRPRPLIARQFLRNASDSSSITERVRRKIWGTDNPPGLKDPYGGEGVFEKKFKKGREGRQVVPEEEAVEVSQGKGANAETQNIVPEVAEPVDSSYEPATSWEGIQRIGHLGKWTDVPATDADAYTSFSSNRRLTKPGLLYLAAQQAAVELSVMHSLQLPLTRICDVIEHEEAVFELLYHCKVQPKSGGQWDLALEYPDKEAEDALVYIFKQIGAPAEPTETAAETEEITEEVGEVEEAAIEEAEPVQKTRGLSFFGHTHSYDNGFLSLSLADPAIKFAFVKRFSQLAGHHLPDPVIESAASIQNIIDHVLNVTKPKPKKLAQELAANKGLTGLPNVKVFAKRQGPRDKDEELGRRKLIEAELRERGLSD